MLCVDERNHIIGEMDIPYRPGLRVVEIMTAIEMPPIIMTDEHGFDEPIKIKDVSINAPVDRLTYEFEVDDMDLMRLGVSYVYEDVAMRLVDIFGTQGAKRLAQDKLAKAEVNKRLERPSTSIRISAPVIKLTRELEHDLFDHRGFTPC